MHELLHALPLPVQFAVIGLQFGLVDSGWVQEEEGGEMEDEKEAPIGVYVGEEVVVVSTAPS